MDELNLKGVIAAKGISIEALGALLGLHRNTVANKLGGESSFTVSEALAVKKNLCPEYDLEFLFSPPIKKD